MTPLPNTLVEPVSVLFISGRSIYKHMPGLDCWDSHRDARQFAGRNPVIAHPPCRTWSKYLRHLAKPLDMKAEQELAFFALEKVLQNGGVLEQPAGSKFWEAAKLPIPNETTDPFLYTIYVEQSWFGYCTKKPTWLLIAGVPKAWLPEIPFSLDRKQKDKRTMCQATRSRTMKPFAEWLCQVARLTWWQFRKAA